MSLVTSTFTTTDASWRGLGSLEDTGYELRGQFARFSLSNNATPATAVNSEECICGSVLLGKKKPTDCPSFGYRCVPTHPVGPCMVSQEGTCSTYYAYGRTCRLVCGSLSLWELESLGS